MPSSQYQNKAPSAIAIRTKPARLSFPIGANQIIGTITQCINNMEVAANSFVKTYDLAVDPILRHAQSYITAKTEKTSSSDFIYGLTTEESSVALYQLFNHIDSFAENKNYQEIDRLFEIIDFQKLTPALTVGLLRVNYANKSHLRHWNLAVHRAKFHLERHVENASQLLKGLL